MYRILIIEDDRTIANVLAEHLRTWDYEVHCVTNFKNVWEDFREYEASACAPGYCITIV